MALQRVVLSICVSSAFHGSCAPAPFTMDPSKVTTAMNKVGGRKGGIMHAGPSPAEESSILRTINHRHVVKLYDVRNACIHADGADDDDIDDAD
eukprot:6172901-Pleurochrysis_carterae.AAC.2